MYHGLISNPPPEWFLQAESELSDKNKREELDAIINQARITILKSLNLPTSLSDTDSRLREIGEPSFKVRVRAKAKDMLIEEELRRRKYAYCCCNKFNDLTNPPRRRAIKMNLANEGLEARKKDEEVAAKKRKAEEDKHWEGTFYLPFSFNFSSHLCTENREQRVDSWRTFANNNTRKKKKQKVAILG